MATGPYTLLVTRPLIDQQQTCDALRALGIKPVSAPVMNAERLVCDIPKRDWQALIVTSRNALRMLDDAELEALIRIPVHCVGERTESLARALGFAVAAPASPDLDHLSARLKKRLAADAGPLLYLTARHRSGILTRTLTEAGMDVELREIYHMKPEEVLQPDVICALKRGDIDGILLYSQRTSRLFLSLIDKNGLAPLVKRLTYFCLSPAVGSPVREAGYPLVVAEAPNETSLLECVKKDRN